MEVDTELAPDVNEGGLVGHPRKLPFAVAFHQFFHFKPVPCPAGGLAERGLDLMPSPFGVGMGSPFQVR